MGPQYLISGISTMPFLAEGVHGPFESLWTRTGFPAKLPRHLSQAGRHLHMGPDDPSKGSAHSSIRTAPIHPACRPPGRLATTGVDPAGPVGIRPRVGTTCRGSPHRLRERGLRVGRGSDRERRSADRRRTGVLQGPLDVTSPIRSRSRSQTRSSGSHRGSHREPAPRSGAAPLARIARERCRPDVHREADAALSGLR